MKNGTDAWKGALTHFDDTLPLCWDRSAGPMLEPHSDLLFDMTQGRLGSLTEVLSMATKKTIESRKVTDERLTEAVLKQSAVSLRT